MLNQNEVIEMETNAVTRVIKAGAALLAVAGIVVSPETQDQIVIGYLAVYSVMSAIQAKLGK